MCSEDVLDRDFELCVEGGYRGCGVNWVIGNVYYSEDVDCGVWIASGEFGEVWGNFWFWVGYGENVEYIEFVWQHSNNYLCLKFSSWICFLKAIKYRKNSAQYISICRYSTELLYFFHFDSKHCHNLEAKWGWRMRRWAWEDLRIERHEWNILIGWEKKYFTSIKETREAVWKRLKRDWKKWAKEGKGREVFGFPAETRIAHCIENSITGDYFLL